jgi:hypothetical protein
MWQTTLCAFLKGVFLFFFEEKKTGRNFSVTILPLGFRLFLFQLQLKSVREISAFVFFYSPENKPNK